jgi:hypothetical protein
VYHQPIHEPVAEPIPQRCKVPKIRFIDVACRFNFDRYNRPASRFNDQIDFSAGGLSIMK